LSTITSHQKNKNDLTTTTKEEEDDKTKASRWL
jgi:hypothetical protein